MSYIFTQEESNRISRAVKGSLRLATTTPLNLSLPITSIDGYPLADQDRILVRVQSLASENGLYQWSNITGKLTRTNDGRILASGLILTISEGLTYADTLWSLKTNDPIIVGITPLDFALLAPYPSAPSFPPEYVLVMGGSVNGSTSSVSFGAIPFDPSNYASMTSLEFVVVMSTTDTSFSGTVNLYNLTDREFITGTTINTSSTDPVKISSGALTIGSGVGEIKTSERFYQVWLSTNGPTNNDMAFLDIGFFKIS